ncbi:MAG: glycoside hydrolase family 2 protein, partial [Planctomycetota bacterium]
KMACNFGWDWGPPLLTCGVWRPAYLETWSAARLGDARPVITRADEERAEIDLRVDVAASSDGNPGEVFAELLDPQGATVASASRAADQPEVALALAVDSPRLWWPRGYGEQPRYDLKIELRAQDGSVLDARQHRAGLRTTALCTDPDPEPHDGLGQGETMHLVVNGKRVYCKGANWIPDDCFPHRVTPERYRQRIDQAADANMNMLRIWGGGIYEDRSFYEHCDEIGMLVWQDFLLACAAYHEEEPFWSWFEAEARDNVSRLSPHPSLVLWCGCNENIWATFDWSDQWRAIREEGKLTWGGGYYLDLFPRVVDELAPATPYCPGSPYSGTMDRHPNANENGDTHM